LAGVWRRAPEWLYQVELRINGCDIDIDHVVQQADLQYVEMLAEYAVY
jgi:hypothetical protein